ncbi:hypothetical protein AB0I77_28795 [Streptomyces sp. NPDC050619]|uniref:hypothetical protein n=1 Tax=Streptomyces sp. NPDC050619 TaxID=3157214 RepID=UPI003430449F
MAYENSIAALPALAAHPMAKPGYGKRSAPDQKPPRRGDFDHLPAREAYLAALLDRLCENAAMDAKTLAKAQPLYGQQAVRSALNELGRAGHLRRVRRRIQPEQGGTGTRWVFHTYWSRTARDDEWWARFLDGDVPPETDAAGDVAPHTLHGASADSPQPKPRPTPEPQRPATSAAYNALAQLGLRDPRLALSSADCAALEELAGDWLARGVTAEQLVQIVSAGLPEDVHSPRAFVRRRLVDKLPPERPAVVAQLPRTLMECTDCGVPGRPEALPGGLCRACGCRDGSVTREPTEVRPSAVRARAAQVRAAIRTPQRA